MGHSHPDILDIPKEVKCECPSTIEIVLKSFNKIVVGEFAANIRAIRKPEPYKGKGIMYENEKIVRKVGKTAEGAKK
jgi:large subunit ribosomal protein L6